MKINLEEVCKALGSLTIGTFTNDDGTISFYANAFYRSKEASTGDTVEEAIQKLLECILKELHSELQEISDRNEEIGECLKKLEFSYKE